MKIVKDEYGYIFKDEDVSESVDATAYAVMQIKKTQTNYDRLISKTLEELAEKMVDYSYCPPGTACKPTCKECWLLWLKAPVEEVDNG